MFSPGPIPILTSGWVVCAFAAAAIAARLYLRLGIQKRNLLISDFFICAAWASAVVTNSLYAHLYREHALEKSVKASLQGFHGDPRQVPHINKIFWLTNIPLWSTFYLSTGALLALYLKIFPSFMRKRRIFLWCTIIYVPTAYVASLLTMIFLCPPTDRLWHIGPKSQCLIKNGRVVFAIAWALHFLGDVLVFTLPWLVMPTLQIHTAVKVGLFFTFFLGIINITICLLRIITVTVSQVDSHAGNVNAKDDISLSVLVFWNTLECNSSVLVACFPALRPYFSGYKKTEISKSSDQVVMATITPENDMAQVAADGPSALRQFRHQSQSRSISDDGLNGGSASNPSVADLLPA